MTEQFVRLSTPQIETISGLSAGIVSTALFHPLDIIKTRLQVYRSSPSVPITTAAILRGLICSPSPIKSLYRGITPNLLGNAGSWSLFLGLKSVIEDRIIKSRTFVSHNFYSKDNNRLFRPRDLLTPFDYFLASGISGMIITLSTNPFWVIKTRMLISDRGNEGAYVNIWQGAEQIFRREGLRGFYKGAGISMLGNCHGAVQFSVYEPIKNIWKNYVARNDKLEENGQHIERLGVMATLTISGLAKVIAGTVTYPVQVMRSRLQAVHSDSASRLGITGVSKSLWEEKGWKGFYKGLSINIIRVLPATWTTFLVYENMKYFLARLG
ncbi:Mitochondrial FAD carrier protein FLX1 [Golovinomyces cichoracearum]|uniref:Mitochondrial FAD carrier protein FLX1 n=1 Tax=Golovinomyces cichoracearum TaxID=62708 RepID=A0A420I6E3_9PEZI|nr:Mitochondrial FAD carrier protein FLX1 [Golovinomyces cichoracearum]